MQRQRPVLDISDLEQEEKDHRETVINKIDENISEQMTRTLDIIKKETKKQEQIDEDRMKSPTKIKDPEEKDSLVESSQEDAKLVAIQRQ